MVKRNKLITEDALQENSRNGAAEECPRKVKKRKKNADLPREDPRKGRRQRNDITNGERNEKMRHEKCLDHMKD